MLRGTRCGWCGSCENGYGDHHQERLCAEGTTVAVGDTVQFTNSDTVAHQVIFKSMTGVACSPSPLVIQPTQAGSCTFVSPGTFSYDDPNTRGNTFRGTITVAGPTTAETLTLSAKPQTVIYAGKLTLSGVLSTLKVGENVDVLATACGQHAANKITTVQTTTGGAYAQRCSRSRTPSTPRRRRAPPVRRSS